MLLMRMENTLGQALPKNKPLKRCKCEAIAIHTHILIFYGIIATGENE